MPFYTFYQNNSGGYFHFEKDRGVTCYVIIEAPNTEAACVEAIMHGLYFDGCTQGIDCSCCGDRWSRPWREDGTKVPMVYGYKVGEPHELSRWMEDVPEGVIHYADGRRQWFDRNNMPVDF